MRLWRAILLINLALGLGLFLGYLAWGREYARLEEQLERARDQIAARAIERAWTVRGVVRVVLPEQNIVVLTHEEIAGVMPSMTMGFRIHDPQLARGLEAGDVVRVVLTGVPPDLVITAIAREGRS